MTDAEKVARYEAALRQIYALPSPRQITDPCCGCQNIAADALEGAAGNNIPLEERIVALERALADAERRAADLEVELATWQKNREDVAAIAEARQVEIDRLRAAIDKFIGSHQEGSVR